MKKVIIYSLSFILLLTLIGCGSNKKTSSDENNNTKAESKDTKSTNTFNWNGYIVKMPDDFEYDRGLGGYSGFKGKAGTSTDIYLVFSYIFGYQSLEKAKPNFTLSDVPNIMNDSVVDMIYYYDHSPHKNISRKPKKTSETTFLDNKVIRETGTINTTTYKGENHIYSYVAYYSKLSFPEYGSTQKPIPSIWITFAQTEDPKIVQKLENIADTVATTATYKKD